MLCISVHLLYIQDNIVIKNIRVLQNSCQLSLFYQIKRYLSRINPHYFFIKVICDLRENPMITLTLRPITFVNFRVFLRLSKYH